MEINKINSVMSAYMKTVSAPNEKKQKAAAAKNVDKAVFSQSAGQLAGAKAQAVRAAESFASPERIAALKAMISDGSYSISAESVAASIFGG